MALKEIYVDPSIAANSGTGTVGDPYGDLAYAIVQETQGTAGTRINIKRGTDEVLSATLDVALADTSVSAAWAYSNTNPIIFQGYDTVAGDLAGTGNRAGISGGGSLNNPILNAGFTANNVHFIDLHLHNVGTSSNGILRLYQYCSVIRCELDNCTGRGLILGTTGLFMGNYVHDVTTYGLDLTSGYVFGNTFTNEGTKEMTRAVTTAGQTVIKHNLISVDGATDGIYITGKFSHVVNNSIYSAAGTGSAIYITTTAGLLPLVSNNLIEGFSGTGGVGIELAGTAPGLVVAGRNLIYDCATAVVNPGDTIGPLDVWGLSAFYESLSSSPFADAANFDFSPVDVGNVKEGAIPSALITE